MSYVVQRLLTFPLILLGVSVLVFVSIRLVPGDAITAMLGTEAGLLTPDQRAALAAYFGIDQPVWAQYLRWLGGLVQGDLGRSFITNRDVVDDFLQRFPATIELSLSAIIFAIALGIPLGLVTAKQRGRWVDQVGTVASLIGISIPIFFLGLMLKWLFAIQWPILPDSGRIDLIEYYIPRVTNFMTIDAILAGEWGGFIDAVRHLILPAVALGYEEDAEAEAIADCTSVDCLPPADYYILLPGCCPEIEGELTRVRPQVYVRDS